MGPRSHGGPADPRNGGSARRPRGAVRARWRSGRAGGTRVAHRPNLGYFGLCETGKVLRREDPLTKRERAELVGYVSRSTVWLRAGLFALALAAVAGLAFKFQRSLSIDQPVWVVPTALVGLALYWRSRRWTGGRDLRARIRADLESNTAAVHVLPVVDAIEVEEAEDEGHTFFLQLDTGETVAIGGQFLDRFVSRGFPRKQLEIREGARSGLFLGLKAGGERIVPSLVKPPLHLATVRELGIGRVRWKVLPVPFEDLRRIA